MSYTSPTALADALRNFRLLDQAQLDELARSILPHFSDARALAKELLRRSWLTPYQINQLFQGRGPSLLLGSYVLLERLGEGGMGQVFKAKNWKMGQIVALKLVHKERVENPDALRRFRREIRAASSLNHPNIVSALDADEVGGTRFFAMELIEGTDLAKLVKKQGPLPVAQACEYVRQAALGLQHAHERGLVHRDVKPANLVLTSAGLVKVVDLGLARLTGPDADGESSAVLTLAGSVMGTPDYMAPEQTLDSHGVDIRADLYSLGCTLYFLLTGEPPFAGGSLGQKILRHQTRQPTPVEHLRPDVPRGVAAVVRKLLAKRPEDRYQTPAELAAALAAGGRAAGKAGPTTVPAGHSPSPFAGLADDTHNQSATVGGDRPSRRRVLILGGAGFAAAAAGFTGYLVLRKSTPAGSDRPSDKGKGSAPGTPGRTDTPIPAAGQDTPADADPDFALQGEYAGEGEGKKFAVQVVARGEGQFQARLLPGGLPGAGWDGIDEHWAEGSTEGAGVHLRGAKWQGRIAGGRLTGRFGGTTLTLPRVLRGSPTLGAKPPAGAVVLFDGSGVAEWLPGAQVVEGKWLRAGATSRRAFGGCRLHLEFRLPFLPGRRGQARANSGLYLQNRYEIQILDSFGLVTTSTDCGAVYGQTEPSVNVCYPPLSWQTYDLDFEPARFDAGGRKLANAVVTLRHNGVTIHENREILRNTAGGNVESDAPGPLQLQLHGQPPVLFRNVWLVEKR